MIEDLTGGAVQPSGNHFEAAVFCFLGDLLPYIVTPSESNVRSILPLDNPESCISEGAAETESTTAAKVPVLVELLRFLDLLLMKALLLLHLDPLLIMQQKDRYHHLPRCHLNRQRLLYLL